MPIRHCQKCGLKVLIDESQLAANPFFCQRCAAMSKAAASKDAGAPAPMMAREPAPAPAPPPAPAPAPKAEEPPKPGSIKVICPYCKASFTGRLPSRPAKGSCPVCQKDLILLPDGKITEAEGFSVSKWQRDQEAAKSTGDRAMEKARQEMPPEPPKPIPVKLEPRMTKVRRAEPPAAVAGIEQTLMSPPGGIAGETILDMGGGPKTPPKPASAEMEEAFPGGAGLHEQTILDMGSKPATKTAKPSASEMEEAFPGGAGLHEQTILDMGASKPGKVKPSASEVEEAFPGAGLGGETMLDMGDMSRKAAERAPDPAPDPDPPPPPPPPPPPESADTQPEAPPVPAPPPPPPEEKPQARPGMPVNKPSKLKVLAAAFFLLVPLGVGAALWFLRAKPALQAHLSKVESIAQRGLHALYKELTKERPPEPPKPPPPKRTTEPGKPEETPEEKARKRAEWKLDLERRMTEAHLKILRSQRAIRSMPDPSEGQKELIRQEEEKVRAQKKILDECQATYKKEFGEEFKPADE
jgi:hypothetical protein